MTLNLQDVFRKLNSESTAKPFAFHTRKNVNNHDTIIHDRNNYRLLLRHFPCNTFQMFPFHLFLHSLDVSSNPFLGSFAPYGNRIKHNQLKYPVMHQAGTNYYHLYSTLFVSHYF